MDNFKQDSTDKYLQRHIISKAHWNRNSPIFIYTGNEDDIEWFCENTGFVWEIAEQFNAMIIFEEHRYYRKSIPYGDKSYYSPYIHYLISEQALANFANIITFIKLNETT